MSLILCISNLVRDAAEVLQRLYEPSSHMNSEGWPNRPRFCGILIPENRDRRIGISLPKVNSVAFSAIHVVAVLSYCAEKVAAVRTGSFDLQHFSCCPLAAVV